MSWYNESEYSFVTYDLPGPRASIKKKASKRTAGITWSDIGIKMPEKGYQVRHTETGDIWFFRKN